MQLTKQQINYCMECGVCTGSCPISQEIPSFSPRQMIKQTIEKPEGEILLSNDLWKCLTCSRCSDRCPVKIDFPEFIRNYRVKAKEQNNLPQLSHNGILHTIPEIQAGNLTQNRTDWAKENGRFKEKGEYFYFVGCAPYFDIVFEYLNVPALQSAANVLQLLNRLGIEPVISNDECCCGHDAFWSGNETLFKILAEKNMKAIEQSGAKKVLFSCPEGYNIFKETYPAYFDNMNFDIIYLADFLSKEIPKSDIEFFNNSQKTVTYQDPCRLGRREGIYEEPRQLIDMVPGIERNEMEHNRENAVCCGTTAWMQCSSCSKAMQTRRLNEAEQAKAEQIITACPKCQIHLTCAANASDMEIGITDLYTHLADHLQSADETD